MHGHDIPCSHAAIEQPFLIQDSRIGHLPLIDRQRSIENTSSPGIVFTFDNEEILKSDVSIAKNYLIIEISQNPKAGQAKKGNLSEIRVYKFKENNTLFLLSYRLLGEELQLIMLGTHENFY